MVGGGYVCYFFGWGFPLECLKVIDAKPRAALCDPTPIVLIHAFLQVNVSYMHSALSFVADRINYLSFDIIKPQSSDSDLNITGKIVIKCTH